MARPRSNEQEAPGVRGVMRLWLLQPRAEVFGVADNPWRQYYESVHGFLIRAANEAEARQKAAIGAGAEGCGAWLDGALSTCTEPAADGDAEVLLVDFKSSKVA